MKLYTNLENLALSHLAEQRQGLRGNREMSVKQAVEFMSSSGFFYYHGVHSRRNGIDEDRASKELELSIGRVLRQVGFSEIPDAQERRDILHPPFESFGAVGMDNVVHVDFVNGHVIDPPPIPQTAVLVEPISA